MIPSDWHLLSQNHRRELDRLAAQYGRPHVEVADLGANSFAAPGDLRRRLGEVCMVIRRPSGQLLVFRKTFYPAGIVRLLTGGIQEREGILDALQREVYEETGLSVDIARFLAVVAYRTATGGSEPVMFTHAFFLDETAGVLGAIDAGEQVEEFKEVEPDELLVIADRLDGLARVPAPDLESPWDDWGRFRAVIHRIVWKQLAPER